MSKRDHVEKVSGNCVQSLTSTTFASILAIAPNLIGSTRLTAISDSFMLYRFTKLHITPIQWSTVAAGSTQALGYTVDVVNTPPTTLSDIAELTPVILWLPQSTQNMGPTLKLEKADLLGIVPWYRTRAGSPDDSFEYQGAIYQRSGGTSEVITYRIDYTCELKDFVPTSTTFRRPRLLREQAQSEIPGIAPVVDDYVTLRLPKSSLEHKG